MSAKMEFKGHGHMSTKQQSEENLSAISKERLSKRGI